MGKAFVIVLRTESALDDFVGERVRIIPGMTAEIDILADRHCVTDCPLHPHEGVQERAIGE